jgi:hypothetical protein
VWTGWTLESETLTGKSYRGFTREKASWPTRTYHRKEEATIDRLHAASSGLGEALRAAQFREDPGREGHGQRFTKRRRAGSALLTIDVDPKSNRLLGATVRKVG